MVPALFQTGFIKDQWVGVRPVYASFSLTSNRIITRSKQTRLIKMNNFLNCFCSFELSWPILERDNFIKNLYIILSYLVKWHSFLTLFVSI